MTRNGFIWWIDRWRKSTAWTGMTLEEQGAYRNLLDEAWLRGGAIPNDPRVLAQASGDPKRWAKVRAKVLAKFHLKQNEYRHETIDDLMTRASKHPQTQHNYTKRDRSRDGHLTGNT
jgi:uncharacterized protein YdaU (DUF1376 family)